MALATNVAFGLEGAVGVSAVLHSVVFAPAVFRLVPPSAAGRIYFAVTRPWIAVALLGALAATALRALAWSLNPLPVVLDGLSSVVFTVCASALPQFERARDLALREPGMGSGVEAPAILRSHRLLSGLRGLSLAGAATPLISIAVSH
jgi:hypothetical protein